MINNSKILTFLLISSDSEALLQRAVGWQSGEIVSAIQVRTKQRCVIEFFHFHTLTYIDAC